MNKDYRIYYSYGKCRTNRTKGTTIHTEKVVRIRTTGATIHTEKVVWIRGTRRASKYSYEIRNDKAVTIVQLLMSGSDIFLIITFSVRLTGLVFQMMIIDAAYNSFMNIFNDIFNDTCPPIKTRLGRGKSYTPCSAGSRGAYASPIFRRAMVFITKQEPKGYGIPCYLVNTNSTEVCSNKLWFSLFVPC